MKEQSNHTLDPSNDNAIRDATNDGQLLAPQVRNRSRALDSIVDELASYIAERVVTRLMAGTVSDYVDQSSSPLGPRKHITAIRQGKLTGVKVGRRYLARRKDVDAFVGQTPSANGSLSDGCASDDVDTLAAALGIGRGGR